MAEGENEMRWDGLCSRDSSTREIALENIRQIILRKTEYFRSVKETPHRPSHELSNAVSSDGLNKLLAHLLMLSKRCPFKDVREKSEFILKSVQGTKTSKWFKQYLKRKQKVVFEDFHRKYWKLF